MDNRNTVRSEIQPGMRVAIVLKKDQPTGMLTVGTVKRILTNSATHHRGIKVILEEDDLVGRVQKILDEREEPEMEYVGSVEYGGDKSRIFTEDWDKFYADRTGLGKMPKTQIQCWALYLNSPWTNCNVGYHLQPVPSKGRDAAGGIAKWRCSYCTMGYDRVFASVAGYGETPEEAIRHCKARFRLIQKKYNPESKKILEK